MRLKRLLAAKGIHYFVTRFGPAWLRGLAFDEKYQRGDWNFKGESSNELPSVVQKYLRGGDLLILGCGGASILDSFEPAAFSSVLGLDLSTEAVRLASRFARENILFQVGDMVGFQCPRDYDVILFSESLYYVPSSRQEEVLRRLAGNLKAEGALVVTLAQARRYHAIIELIRRCFQVVEDRKFSNSERHLIVFR
jgi:2-polyprenyl-3-methyl-5-hydroxy-6-metoxy-1,4-benzoquinol methylase